MPTNYGADFLGAIRQNPVGAAMLASNGGSLLELIIGNMEAPAITVRRTTNGDPVVSSTDLVADDVLLFTPKAGRVKVTGRLKVNTHEDAGIILAINGSPANIDTVLGKTYAESDQHILRHSDVATLLDETGDWIFLTFTSEFDCGNTEYGISIAQSVSTAQDTQILAGSYIEWKQL